MPRPRPKGIHVWSVVGRKPRMGKGLCPRCGRLKENPKAGWCNKCHYEWTVSHREAHRRSQSRYARSVRGRRIRREYKLRERGLAGTPIRASAKKIQRQLAKFRKGEILFPYLRQFLLDSPQSKEEAYRILKQLRWNQKKSQ